MPNSQKCDNHSFTVDKLGFVTNFEKIWKIFNNFNLRQSFLLKKKFFIENDIGYNFYVFQYLWLKRGREN